MIFTRKALLLAAVAALSAAGTASATTITFYQLTANNDTAVEAQLTVDVTDPGNDTVDFTFYNNVGINSALTNIYFADGTLLALATISVSGGGVSFAALANPAELPGAATASPAFVTTPTFSADSRNFGQGVGGAAEWVRINFTLQDDQTYADTLEALTTGELRIGLQVGLNNSASAFDSYVNNPLVTDSNNQLVSVPDSGSTAALLGSVLLAVGVFGRKFRKS